MSKRSKLLWLFGVLLYFLLATWIFFCWCQDCGKNTDTEKGAAATYEAVKAPIYFNGSDTIAKFTEHFEAYRSKLLESNGKDSILQIVGYYINDPQVGLARAAEIRKRFPNIPDSLIQLRAVPKTSLAQVGDNQFVGHEINWLAPKVAEPITGNEAVEPVDDGGATRESLSGQEFIRFPTNSAQKISSSEVDKYLDEIADWAKTYGGTVDLVGHADNRGTPENNLRLGQNRADAIKNILIRKGVAVEQIQTSSKGEAQPTASNATADGQALNRRVEVRLIDKQ